jgi:hydrogenase-1 operon protein HyaF
MSAAPAHADPRNAREPPRLTGMADAVLSEIATRLAEYAAGGASWTIELTAIPLTTEDRAELESRLGRGEVVATIESAGRSEVWETRFAGVWFVRHFGDGDRIAAESIEIIATPEILRSHPADMRAAAKRLAAPRAGAGAREPDDA